MQVIRYLNGRRLHGIMPPLLLNGKESALCWVSRAAGSSFHCLTRPPLLYWKRRDAVSEGMKYEAYSALLARFNRGTGG